MEREEVDLTDRIRDTAVKLSADAEKIDCFVCGYRYMEDGRFVIQSFGERLGCIGVAYNLDLLSKELGSYE